MPTVRTPAVLKAVYAEASRLIKERSIPTELLAAPRTVFHYFSRDYVNLRFNGVFPRRLANQALVVRGSIGTYRFSGAPGVEGVPEFGGLYCSTQQQTQIHELLHYARRETVNPEMAKSGLARPMKIPPILTVFRTLALPSILNHCPDPDHGRLYRRRPLATQSGSPLFSRKGRICRERARCTPLCQTPQTLSVGLYVRWRRLLRCARDRTRRGWFRLLERSRS
jgi:hypothetical protein